MTTCVLSESLFTFEQTKFCQLRNTLESFNFVNVLIVMSHSGYFPYFLPPNYSIYATKTSFLFSCYLK